MPQWLNTFLNNPRAWISALFFAFVIGSSILKKVKEVKKDRERKQRAEQAELERLRTGGVEPVAISRPQATAASTPPHRPMMPAPETQAGAPRAATLEEIAEARRRKIEELRRKQQGGQAPQQPSPRVAAPSSGSATRVVRLPNGVTIEVPADPTAAAAVESRQPQPQAHKPKSSQRPPKRAPERAPERAQQNESVRANERANEAAYAQAAPPQVAIQPHKPRGSTPTIASGIAAAFRGADRASVRRAIVMSEVLGAPVSTRT